MGKKKGHHFLPRFYLKSFGFEKAENPPVWVHEKDAEPQPLRISVIGKKKNLYSTRKGMDGELNPKSEDLLSDAENIIAPVYRKVLANESADVLTEEERALFGIFVILMSNRTPRSFEIADADFKKFEVQQYQEATSKLSDEEFRQIYETTKAANSTMQDVTYEEAKAVMLEGPKVENVRLSHSAGISEMWGSLPQVMPMLMEMDWKFWVPVDNQRFVTSDDPVVGMVQDEKGGILIKPGWGHPSLEVTLPLSPKLCFVATRGGGIGRTEMEGADIINELRVLMSHQYIYASRKFDFQKLFEEREKHKATEPWRLGKLY